MTEPTLETAPMGDAFLGARAALETLDKLLAEFAAERGLDASDPFLSIDDVRRFIGAARVSIS